MSGKLVLRSCMAALCIALALLTGREAGAQSAALFETLPQTAVSSIAPAHANRLRALRESPITVALQLVRVKLGALQDETVSIALPDGGSVAAQRRNLVTRSPSNFTWIGKVRTTGGDVILVVRNGDVTGEIHNGRDHYRLTPLGGGIHALIKVDRSKLPGEPPIPRAPQQRGNVSGPAVQPTAANGAIQINVLVAYTRSARLGYGGDTVALAQAWVDATNVYYNTSNINIVLRLVGTREITYSETGKTFLQVLKDLTFGNDPQMAQVHAQRDATEADLVALMVNHTEFCGMAWLRADAFYAFSLTHYNCGSDTFAHELGHNFGADHDPAHATDPPYFSLYEHGYISPFLNWRTIMAYGDDCNFCPTIGHFSNPAVTFEGSPTGTVATHDNARVHRERATTVAAFRPVVAQCSITLGWSPNFGGTVTGHGTFPCGSSRTVMAIPNSGYTFVKWTENGTKVSSSADYTFTLDADRTLFATFKEIQQTHAIAVKASPKAGGTVSGGGTFVAGRSRTVRATPNSGYVFTKWTEGGAVVSTSAKYTFVLDGDRNLVAKFAEAHTVDVSAAPKAWGTVDGGGTFVAGSVCKVIATANSGYVFVNWTENGSVVSKAKRYAFTLNADRVLIANFKKTYTIGVSASPGAGGAVVGGGSFPSGSSRTVIATPTAGYAFVNWTENGAPVSTAKSYAFKLKADRDLVANFVDDKTQFLVNTYTLNSQRRSKVAALYDGGYLVVWTSEQELFGTEIYAQRFDANGERVGAEFLVNTYTSFSQTEPSAAGLSDGGFVAVWTSAGQDGAGIFGQRYDAEGNPTGAEFPVNTTTAGEQTMPAVAGLSAGGYVVVWVLENGPSFEIYGQRFNAKGKPVGGEFRVGTYSDAYAQAPSVAGLSNGGFIVMVGSDRGDGTQFNVYGQRYRANGRPVGREIRVNTYIENAQWNPSVVGLVDGGFAVVWASLHQLGPSYIMGQRYTAGGKRTGKNFQINDHSSSTQQQPAVASLEDGGFVAAWASYGQDGSLFGVFGRRYTADGSPAGAPFPLNSYTANEQFEPSVAGRAGGGFVATWTSIGPKGDIYDVYGTQFAP